MKRKSLVMIFAGFVFIDGFFSLVWVITRRNILEIPFSEFTMIYQGTTLLGISLMTISMVISVFGFLVLTLGKDWFSSVLDWFESSISKPRMIFVLTSIMILSSLIAGQLLLQTGTTENALQRSFLVMNRPFFTWFIHLSLFWIGVLVVSNGSYRRVIHPDFSRPFLLTLALIVFVFILSESHYGFQQISAIGGSFRLTGYPILGYQVFFAWIGVIGLFFLVRWVYLKWGKGKKIPPLYLDLIIGLILFASAFFIWRSAPVEANAFIDQPRPPNYEFNPNLDAVFYDRTAQNLLATGKLQSYIDEENWVVVARRPLLAFYLAALHWVGGLGYEGILDLQLAFFALLPVLIFLFTKIIHNRKSGLLTAILVIIRLQTGLRLGSEVWGGTNLHMLLSDFPATIGVLLFLTLFIVWLKKPGERNYLSLITGGVLGLTMLIRQEVAVILFFACLAAFLGLRDHFKLFLKNMFLILIGTIVVITPWICRNWVKTGIVFLDMPDNRLSMIANTLNILKEGLDFNSDESDPVDEQSLEGRNDLSEFLFNSRTSEQRIGGGTILQSVTMSRIVFREDQNWKTDQLPGNEKSISTDFAVGNNIQEFQNQQGSVGLIANHYSNAILQSFLYLPSYPLALDMDYLLKLANGQLDKEYGGLLYSPYKYTKSLPYWWPGKWDGKIDHRSWIYISVVVGLFSLGFYRVWKKERWVALVPPLSMFAFISIYAIILRSGGRFLLEVDWITTMFLCIGLIEFSMFVIGWWRGQGPKGSAIEEIDFIKTVPEYSAGNKISIAIFLLIILLGSLPVLAEIVLPNHYPDHELNQQLELLLDVENPALNLEEQNKLKNFMDNGGEVIYGRALYPRYFPPGAELMTTNETLFSSSTTFTIAGTELNFVVLPRLGSPTSFPHGSDVLTFGCRETSFPPDPGFICLGCRSEGFDALSVMILNQEDEVEDILWRDGALKDFSGCPLVWPGE